MTGNDEMHTMDDLLAAYVIDALDDDERADVDLYLDANPAPRSEVRRLAIAFDELVAAQSAPVTPPADLWDRIEAQLGDQGKVPTGWPAAPAPGVLPGSTAPATAPDELGARRAGRARGRTVATALVLAAAAVAVVVIGLALRPTGGDSTLTAARVEQEAGRAAAVPGAREGTLTSTDGTVSVRVVLGTDGRMYAVPQQLPALDDEHTYQLWALDSGTPVSLGVLRGAASMDLPAGERPEQLALSREPAGGSPQPTSAPLAAGQLA